MTAGICTGPQCARPAKTKGLCNSHYEQQRRTGATWVIGVRRLSDEERFWTFVDKTATCWLWSGCDDSRGYGAFR